ncbi:putative calcium-transporting ATPase 13, plasma membrane-type [Ipomoea triloba]|uniref:putative calcium-transporting ATPase 13, plasma membrane-type n=1 Tax=Ipomoea triloba TaxID=35885 RepID=UPI00125DE040|nr:putative calcium-transporting ATPase 13, plasma membrane-type [Ipomoea triloba]
MENENMSTEMEIHDGNTTRQNNPLGPIIYLFQSMHLFIAGAVASLSRVPSYSVLSSTDAEAGQDLEIGVVDDADGAEPAVSGHNNSSASQTDNIGIELQSQMSSFKRIFREKNLQSLNDSLGGVASVADAFNSHLETGISDNSEEISQRKMVQFSQNWAQAHNYLHFLKKPCMVLLFLAGVLSLVFGIKEEGLQSGWVDGAIVFVTLFLLILITSIRDWSEERRARKKSQKEQILQEVGVVRGGKKVLIYVSDLVYGDLVCLEAGCLVPADGLFVSGEGLEIDDDGTLSICNQQNPFLFYGSIVVKGSAKMLVTSKGMDDTVLGEMMKEELASTQKKAKTETKIDKLSEFKDIVGLILSILLFVVVFLRFLGGKIDGDSGNRPDSKGAPTELERILHYLKIIFTESKGNSRVFSILICVSLVGLMEGMPFVVAIAIRHWNSKTLSDRASAKDESSCVRMAEVTTICIENNVGWLKEDRIEVGETRDRPIASLLASGIKLILFSQNHDVSELKQLIISREIGISETDAADTVLTLTGDELQQCPDEEMFEKLGSITVVGKCNSKLKQRIVRCLRSKGEVVAVVGERSGDALVMKEADIGLAIKSEYSEITTQSANVIIMKGSFSLLIDMIICGRNIYENLQKFIQVDMINDHSQLTHKLHISSFLGRHPIILNPTILDLLSYLNPRRPSIAVCPTKQKPPGHN